MIKVLYWNCRGIANSPSLRALHHLISSNSPDIVLLSEPKTLSPPSLLTNLGFDGFFSNNNQSTASIWCLFKTNSAFQFSLSDFSTQFLTLTFTNPVNGIHCLLTGVYASTNYIHRRDLWEYLTSQASSSTPWCVLGDFNSIIFASEKLCLRPSRLNTDFQQMMLASGLQDMGFSGNKFTWSSNRRGTSYVAARLDRALCNYQWTSISSDPLLSHLPKVSSDHCPLLLSHS